MMTQEQLQPILEAILFAADSPVKLSQLVPLFEEEGIDKEGVETCLEQIRLKYSQGEDFGFELRTAQGGYLFYTKTKYANWIRKYLQRKPLRLGKSSLEVLAIIAYKQPITRAEIDSVRGIDSSHIVRSLIERGLVRMAGKADVPGKPVQYATTDKFLEILSLKSLSELPPLSELKELEGDTASLDKMEANLEKFVDSQVTIEKRLEEDEKSYSELANLIGAVDSHKKEIYSSPEHKEVAEENTLAAQGLRHAFQKTFKKIPPTTVSQPVPE